MWEAAKHNTEFEAIVCGAGAASLSSAAMYARREPVATGGRTHPAAA